MALYHLHEDGIVTGATVAIAGEHTQPKNAFFASDEDREKIERWIKNGRKVFWNENVGVHLDSTAEEAPPKVEAPVEAVVAEPEIPVEEDPQYQSFVACLKALVACVNETDSVEKGKHAQKAKAALDAALGGDE